MRSKFLLASTAIPLLAAGLVLSAQAGDAASGRLVVAQALPGDAPARARPEGGASGQGQGQGQERPRRERGDAPAGERRQGAQGGAAGDERPRRERPAAEGADPTQPRQRPAAEQRDPTRPARDPAAGTAQPAPRGTSPATRPTAQDAKPATAQDAKPAAAQDAKPATAQPAKPATAQDAKPAAAQDAKPATAQDAKPATAQDAKPATAQDAKPATPAAEPSRTTEPATAPRGTDRPASAEGRPRSRPDAPERRRDTEIERRPADERRRDTEIERRPADERRRDVEIERRPADERRRDVEIERRPGELRRDTEIERRRDVEIERRSIDERRRDVEIERRPGELRRDVEIERRREIGDARDLRIEDLRGRRRERVEEGGRRVIIEEPGDRTIVREGNRVIIRHDETQRFRRSYGDAAVRVERRGENEVTIVRRPNGVEIVTVRDPEGNLVRRVRREPAGNETVLIENIIRDRPRRTIVERTVDLPPVQVRIPREKYVVEVERASQEELNEALTAPPVERIQRSYTLDEVRQSRDLRQRVRRIDIDTVTFDFGSWELTEEQAGALTGVAKAILQAVERNPNEIFLIEGHTDAVGPDVDNLTLSDRRAETVATILTERFGVPAENLTTQGYGEQYLKVSTEEPERQNRRVTVRRITPLLKGAAAQ